MASWNFHKRISSAPGMWINISKSGVSSSIGGEGTTVNFGKKGTYLTTSIPGTGIYSREKIGEGYDGDDSSIASFVIKLLCVGFMVFMGIMLRKVVWISIGAYVLAGLYLISAIISLIKAIAHKRNVRSAKNTKIVNGSRSANTADGNNTSSSHIDSFSNPSTAVDPNAQADITAGNSSHIVPESFDIYNGLSDTRAVLEYIYLAGKISPSAIQRCSGFNYMRVIDCLMTLEDKKILRYEPDEKQYVFQVDTVDKARELLGE